MLKKYRATRQKYKYIMSKVCVILLFIKQGPQEDQDPRVCQVETAKRETRETRAPLVSRESRDIRVTLELLDILYVTRLFSITQYLYYTLYASSYAGQCCFNAIWFCVCLCVYYRDNLAFQVSMDRREKGDCRVSLASQVIT